MRQHLEMPGVDDETEEKTDPGLSYSRLKKRGNEKRGEMQESRPGVPRPLIWAIIALGVLIIGLCTVTALDRRKVRSDLMVHSNQINLNSDLIDELQATLANEVIDVGEENDRLQAEVFDVQRAAQNFYFVAEAKIEHLEETNARMAQTVLESRRNLRSAEGHASAAANRAEQMESRLSQLSFMTAQASEVFTSMVGSGACDRDGLYEPGTGDTYPVWACYLRGERVRIYCNNSVIGFANNCFVVPRKS